ncbi:uncharacterized protein C11orf91 homolog isoform X2 [Pseudophryne corroboree]|uniref:uncharacterized protein C11orf91 homolog isoform X2 n=1 Tax=Pseudophryne corroboree TaxID=495146 RepID=UPI00308134F5
MDGQLQTQCYKSMSTEGVTSPKMEQYAPVYFPSLYDKSVSTSPDKHFNIWKSLGITLKDQPEPELKNQAEEISHWPSVLADMSNEPLYFYSTPLWGNFKPQPSPYDELCELEIQIKEMELLMILGNDLDAQKYNQPRQLPIS